MSQSQAKLQQNAQLKFELLCQFFEKCSNAKKHAEVQKHVQTFLRDFLNRDADDLFQVYRLVLPAVTFLLQTGPLPGYRCCLQCITFANKGVVSCTRIHAESSLCANSWTANEATLC